MRTLCIIFSTVGWAWAALVLAYLAGFQHGRRRGRLESGKAEYSGAAIHD